MTAANSERPSVEVYDWAAEADFAAKTDQEFVAAIAAQFTHPTLAERVTDRWPYIIGDVLTITAISLLFLGYLWVMAA